MGTAVALLAMGSLALISAGLVAQWKQRQVALYDRYGRPLPRPGKSAAAQRAAAAAQYTPLDPRSAPARNTQYPGKAAYLVAQGRFVRGLQLNRRTQDGRITPHWGIDIAAPIGTPVYAAKSGIVLSVGPVTGYGNAVQIRHDGGGSSLYGHLHEYIVSAGQRVAGGDLIGAVGRTSAGPDGRVPSWGATMGPHLHAEFHQTDTPVLSPTTRRLDPVAWLQGEHIAQYGSVAPASGSANV